MQTDLITSRSNHPMRSLFALIAILIFALSAPVARSEAATSGVSDARYAHLARGMNMGEWMRNGYNSKYGTDDLKKIKSLGFTYIRLPIGSKLLFDPAQPDVLQTENLKHLDDIVGSILAQDLAVDVCMFDDANKVWADTSYATKFATFWRALANHLSTTDPERVFLEDVNEPAADTAEIWNSIQPQLLAAMREGAPKHTLIAFANMRTAPNHWDNIGGLERLQTVADPNVIYNIHFFQPMSFTHQGASWAGETIKRLHELPYPSSPDIIEPLLDGLDPSARFEAETYGREAWNRSKIDRLFHRVADWGHKHQARVLCNEFGVYRTYAPADSRRRWLTDVRESLEKVKIGWGFWEYDGGFAY